MKVFSLFLAVLLLLTPGAFAEEFSIEFAWGDIPLCDSGQPNTVQNPQFELTGVPEGTKFISFRLTDLDVPSYNHGGGRIAYTGQSQIAPGAFTYQSPCPPDGSHRYAWKAYAKNKKGMFAKTLGKARAVKQYP